MWKSNVIPDASSGEDQGSVRPRKRVGFFLAIAFRSRRPRGMSLNSTTVESPQQYNDTPSQEALYGASQPEKVQTPSLSRSKSINNPHVKDNQGPPNSTSPVNFRPRRSATFSSSTTSNPLPVRPASVEASRDSQKDPPPTQTAASPRWRLLPFLTRERDSSAKVNEVKQRKGEVVCLDYNALDDRGMRRLEGRSDHRPVTGTYILYI